MVKHSLRNGQIFQSRAIWGAADTGGISAAGFFGGVLLVDCSSTAFRCASRRTGPDRIGTSAVAWTYDRRQSSCCKFRVGWHSRQRSRPYTPVVSDRGSPFGDFRRRSRLPHMAVADPFALCILRSAAGSVALVRGAPPLWKRGRLRCPVAVLFFSSGNPRKRLVVFSTKHYWRLGDIRRGVYGNCCVAHPLCPPGSRALELATNCAPGRLSGSGRRIAVLARADSPPHPPFHAVPRACTAGCGVRDFRVGMRRRVAVVVRVIFLSCHGLLAKPVACPVA